METEQRIKKEIASIRDTNRALSNQLEVLTQNIQAVKDRIHQIAPHREGKAADIIHPTDTWDEIKQLIDQTEMKSLTLTEDTQAWLNVLLARQVNLRQAHQESEKDYHRSLIEADEEYLGAVIDELDLEEHTEEEDILMQKQFFDKEIRTAESRLEARESYIKELMEEIEENKNEFARQEEYLEEAFTNIDYAYSSIKSSVNYAKRFQEAMLPRVEQMREVFQDCFALLKPKDIVSGDFYWFREIDDNKFVVAALDCTGHGIPGAFMSLLGHDLLDDIVLHKQITEPDLILKELHMRIRSFLNQRETNNRDGMDVALCVVDTQLRILEYAGAHNPLVMINNGKFQVIKGNPFAVGGYEKEGERNFTKYTFPIEDSTIFYIYSDGYQDQIGGPHGRRFMASRLQKILYQIHYKPLDKQEKILNRIIDYWMKAKPQMDDMMILGIKI